MNSRAGRLATNAVFIALTATALACSSGPQPVNEATYREDVLKFRADKDAMFKTGSDSPLTAEMKGTFTGLSYWDITPAFRVPALLAAASSGSVNIIQLATSTNTMRRMRKVGSLGFTLNQVSYQLTAFADIDKGNLDRLFVPFGDLTNNTETYGGGRYLELDRTATNIYDLDFNRAYHPFCVFNPSYECPVPPRENRLQVAIPAGERLNSSSK